MPFSILNLVFLHQDEINPLSLIEEVSLVDLWYTTFAVDERNIDPFPKNGFDFICTD